LKGLPKKGHSAYILQGNPFHEFLEEWAWFVLDEWRPFEEKIVKPIFPSK